MGHNNVLHSISLVLIFPMSGGFDPGFVGSCHSLSSEFA